MQDKRDFFALITIIIILLSSLTILHLTGYYIYLNSAFDSSILLKVYVNNTPVSNALIQVFADMPSNKTILPIVNLTTVNGIAILVLNNLTNIAKLWLNKQSTPEIIFIISYYNRSDSKLYYTIRSITLNPKIILGISQGFVRAIVVKLRNYIKIQNNNKDPTYEWRLIFSNISPLEPIPLVYISANDSTAEATDSAAVGISSNTEVCFFGSASLEISGGDISYEITGGTTSVATNEVINNDICINNGEPSSGFLYVEGKIEVAIYQLYEVQSGPGGYEEPLDNYTIHEFVNCISTNQGIQYAYAGSSTYDFLMKYIKNFTLIPYYVAIPKYAAPSKFILSVAKAYDSTVWTPGIGFNIGEVVLALGMLDGVTTIPAVLIISSAALEFGIEQSSQIFVGFSNTFGIKQVLNTPYLVMLGESGVDFHYNGYTFQIPILYFDIVNEPSNIYRIHTFINITGPSCTFNDQPVTLYINVGMINNTNNVPIFLNVMFGNLTLSLYYTTYGNQLVWGDVVEVNGHQANVTIPANVFQEGGMYLLEVTYNGGYNGTVIYLYPSSYSFTIDDISCI